jgi:hypothetical protein
MSAIITIEHLGNQIRYSWKDEFGLHQYHSDIVNTDIGEIRNFKKETVKNGFRYSWNDNSGLHQHYLEG